MFLFRPFRQETSLHARQEFPREKHSDDPHFIFFIQWLFVSFCAPGVWCKSARVWCEIFFPRTRVNENVFLQDCVKRKSLQSTLVEMFRARVENSSSVRVMRPQNIPKINPLSLLFLIETFVRYSLDVARHALNCCSCVFLKIP